MFHGNHGNQVVYCSKLFSIKLNLIEVKVSLLKTTNTGPSFDSRALLRIFLTELGLERGPLSLVIG
jgi:hypothetical protein